MCVSLSLPCPADNYSAQTGKECLLGEDGRDAVAGISNFVKLPGNDYDSLMQAIATVGPVSISVDASWGSYEKGVYNGCSNHTTIDHAVQLVGYGTENGQDYFLVRNSWVSLHTRAHTQPHTQPHSHSHTRARSHTHTHTHCTHTYTHTHTQADSPREHRNLYLNRADDEQLRARFDRELPGERVATSNCRGRQAALRHALRTPTLAPEMGARVAPKNRWCVAPAGCSRTPPSQLGATWSTQRCAMLSPN